jgi:hypothetical protein
VLDDATAYHLPQDSVRASTELLFASPVAVVSTAVAEHQPNQQQRHHPHSRIGHFAGTDTQHTINKRKTSGREMIQHSLSSRYICSWRRRQPIV